MSKYTDLIHMPLNDLSTLIQTCDSMSMLLRRVGFAKYDHRAGCYIREYMSQTGCVFLKRQRHKYTIDDVKKAVSTALSVTDVLTTLGLTPHGNNFSTILKIINDNNIDITCFNVVEARRRNKKEWTFDEIFVENSQIPRSSISRYVKKFKIFPYECVICKNTGSWNGQTLMLTIDHIDGCSTNNNISNLRYLCPNCHSQTATFGRKNRH